MPLAPLARVADIQERLQTIFPDGTPNRNYCTRRIAAKTMFVMLYIGAIEGTERWLRPNQVTRIGVGVAGENGEADDAEVKDP